MHPTELTATILKFVSSIRRAERAGDTYRVNCLREDFAKALVGFVRDHLPATCSYTRADPAELESAMGIELTRYMAALIAGTQPIPNAAEALMRTMMVRRALDALRGEKRHTTRRAAAFTDDGSCTPVGLQAAIDSTEISLGAVSTPSHEDAVIRRDLLRRHRDGLTPSQQLAVFGDEFGVTTDECCERFDCNANAWHKRRFDAKRVSRDRWDDLDGGREAAA